MARAYLATDFHIWPASEYVWDPTANILPPETIHRLEDGLANRATAAEAHVRLAYLDLMANQFEAAAGHLQAADRLTDDANLRYLSALFAGWAAMRQGRTDEAIAAYRRALGWRPTAQTGALALGAALYGRGQRDEASATVERALAHPGVDPWLDYGRGDFPSWSDLIARLRSSLK
jgi:tetratricopeptide (TPR) repeat protein